MKASYAKVSVNVENIANQLENYQAQLLKDVAMFDRLYEENSSYFRELTLYIIAGDKYLEKANKGINVSIMGIMTLALMRTQDAEGARKIDLFLVSANPEDEPVALSSLLELLMPKE